VPARTDDWRRFARSFILAQAGLLSVVEPLHIGATRGCCRAYPDVSVEPDAIFVRDGMCLRPRGFIGHRSRAGPVERTTAPNSSAMLPVTSGLSQACGGQSQFSVLVEADPPRSRSAR